MVSKSNVSSVVKLVVDGKEHELYELNQLYRFSYTQSKEVVHLLSEVGILEQAGNTFKLKSQITAEQLEYLYRAIRYRYLDLESEVIENYRDNALSINTLFVPNFSRLDAQLLVDE